MLVDSHCHLNFPDFDADRTEVMARAAAAGVGYMLTISSETRKADEIVATAAAYDNVFASIGTHPNHAADEPDVSLEEILAAARLPKVVALGECGLDYYRGEQDKEIQQRIFRLHIRASLATGLPLIIHTRSAEEDTIRLLREEGAMKGVIHCFSSSQWLADQALELGFMISFSGIVTFKNARDIQETAKVVAGRAPAGGNRCALSGADAEPGQAQRAGFRGLYGRVSGRSERHFSRRAR